MNESLGSWGIFLKGLPEAMVEQRSEPTERVKHLAKDEYKQVREIIEAEFTRNTAAKVVKVILDRKGLILPEVQGLRFIRKVYAELRQQRPDYVPRRFVPLGIRKIVIEMVNDAVLASKNNSEIYLALEERNLHIYYSQSALNHMCSMARKNNNLPRAVYSRRKPAVLGAKKVKQNQIDFWTARCKEMMEMQRAVKVMPPEHLADLDTFMQLSLAVMAQMGPWNLRAITKAVEAAKTKELEGLHKEVK